jgi:hypothetical protein
MGEDGGRPVLLRAEHTAEQKALRGAEGSMNIGKERLFSVMAKKPGNILIRATSKQDAIKKAKAGGGEWTPDDDSDIWTTSNKDFVEDIS